MTAYGTLAGFDLTGNTEINAELLRTRLWQGKLTDDGQPKPDEELQLAHLRQVVDAAADVPAGLLEGVHARRRAAAAALAARRPGHVTRSLVITPQWRVVVGHGEDSPHESSLTFSATYGLPIWPASGLKGVAAAYARAITIEDDELRLLFGSPRPGETGATDAHRGAVTVFDALPSGTPRLVVDVLTPHVKPYYDQANSTPQQITEQPAEYHNPVPVRFLAVGDTPFRTHIIGRPDHAARFVELLTAAADDLGLGGKTAAGYGYCSVTEEPAR
jgi:CRISPR-associated protein Cmr6